MSAPLRLIYEETAFQLFLFFCKEIRKQLKPTGNLPRDDYSAGRRSCQGSTPTLSANLSDPQNLCCFPVFCKIYTLIFFEFHVTLIFI